MCMKTLLLLVCLLIAPFVYAQTDLALVRTTGEAVVYAVPDEIHISITITEIGNTVKEARNKNNEVSKNAIVYLKRAGIAEKHIQTQYQYVNPVRPNYKKKEISHYEARQSIQICIKDLTKYETIVDNLLEVGVTTIGSPSFKTTESRKYKDQARQKAIVAAKEKAELLAGALGQSIGKAHDIKEKNYSYSAPLAYSNVAVSSNESAQGGDTFALGQLEIKATIEVAFILE